MVEYKILNNIPQGQTLTLQNQDEIIYLVFTMITINGTLESGSNSLIYILNGIIDIGLPNNRAGIWIAPGGQLINNGYLKIQGSVKSNNSPYEYTPAYFADNLGLVISGGTKDYICPDTQYGFAHSKIAYRPSLISGEIELVNLGSLVLNYNIINFVGVETTEVQNLFFRATSYKGNDGIKTFSSNFNIQQINLDTINSDNSINLDDNSTIYSTLTCAIINRSNSFIYTNAISCKNNSSFIINPNVLVSINSRYLYLVNNDLEISGPDKIYYLPKINETIYLRGQVQTNGVTFSSST